MAQKRRKSIMKKTRMGKEKKKGHAGNAVNYVTRQQALKKLQITLPDFRRLCILKGIYPREPRKKFKGTNKTYYFAKDIAFLAHEPLLVKFRNLKVFLRKFKKAVSKKQEGVQKRLLEHQPRYTVDHIVRERYPSFVDAIRDLDDALCMVHLFARLPSIPRKMDSEKTRSCARLCAEFQAYVVRTRSLRKVFVSIKGIYYQAEIMSQTVTWLVPHAFAQELPSDVDFRVMLTFLEFYETLLKFVLFKLYRSENLQYPPDLDVGSDDAVVPVASALILKPLEAPTPTILLDQDSQTQKKEAAISSGAAPVSLGPQLQRVLAAEAAAAKSADQTEGAEGVGLPVTQVDAIDPEFQEKAGDAPMEEAAESEEGRRVREEERRVKRLQNLFSGLKLFLSREVPVESLVLTILSCGGSVGFESPSSPEKHVGFGERDNDVTHQVVDRPTQRHQFLSRDYVQPQWVYDSVNSGMLLPTHEYVPGADLPPHLSPFVDDASEGYVPARRHYLERLKSEIAGNKTSALAVAEGRLADGMEEDEDEVLEDDGEEEAEKEDQGIQDDEDSDAEEERQFARELLEEEKRRSVAASTEAQSEGDQAPAEASKPAKKKAKKIKLSKAEKEAIEAKELAKSMMTGKQRKLYEQMQKGLKRKKEDVLHLQQKAKTIERAKKRTRS